MSQESNTESNSDDKPKKRLTLKKKSGGPSSPSLGGTPSPSAPPAEAKPAVTEPSDTQKPFRMSFKKREEASEEATVEPTSAPEPVVEETPASPSEPEKSIEPEPELPDLPTVSPLSLGKKPKFEKPVEEDTGLLSPPPPVAPPPPVSSSRPGLLGLKDDVPLPPPPPVSSPPQVKNIPNFNAEDAEPEDKPGLLPPVPPPPPIPTPISGGPKPPPGMTIRRDDDEEPSGLLGSSMPPVSGPPPIPMVDDLMDEVVEAEKKKSKSGNSMKGVLVAFVAILVLIGGVGFFVLGIMGMFKSDEVSEAAPSPPPAPPLASAPAAAAPETSKLATDKPQSFLGKTALLTEQVSEKASTEEITDFGEEISAPTPSPEPESPPVTVNSQPTTSDSFVGVMRDVPPAPKATRNAGDPEVRAWIETMSPTGVGRGMMLLNGEKYRVGEVVNPQLNIRWVGLDQQLGILIFEDPYGVRYEKDY